MSEVRIPAELESAIAIVGVAGRFPGARDVDEFWENLCAGRESVRRLSDDEIATAGVSPELAARDDFVAVAAPIADVEMFDAEFFGFSPTEASITDPQHRIFLECAWEALEDAGHVPAAYAGRIGVYAGAGLNTYLLHNLLPAGRDLADAVGMLPLVIGNKADFMVTQASYALGLTGPSVCVSSACSTSLVAAHLGVQALLNFECEMALVGGVTIQVPQTSGYVYQPGGVFSPDGRCRPFDAAGRGTVPGNGAGVAVLKRLEDALADGDRIYALIRASAINNDGRRKVGFTAPSLQGQQEVIAAALALGGMPAETIGYVEAHGTATALGDPLELRALEQAYGTDRRPAGSCLLGSVKSNVGHLDAAAGIAGLIKTALCLRYERLVPTLNHESPNAECKLAGSAFSVNTQLRQWQRPAPGVPLRAGVSSFGIGGTNAHVVLEQWVEPPAEEACAGQDAVGARGGRWPVLPLSARNGTSLAGAVERLKAHVARRPDLPAHLLGHALQTRRTQFSRRTAFVCPPGRPAAEALAEADAVSGEIPDARRPLVFMFPGMGDHHAAMAGPLYRSEAAFARHFDACADILLADHRIDLKSLLAVDGEPAPAVEQVRTSDPFAALRAGRTEGEGPLARAREAHPAIFAVEYALAQLLIGWGLRPTAVIGHSLGEFAAACIAGVLSLPDALRVVVKRAELIEQVPGGSMLAVALPADEVLALLPAELSLAASNTAGSCVVAGPAAPVSALADALTASGVAARRVHAGHAFHSSMLEPIRPALAAVMETVNLNPPTVPLVTNVTGTWLIPAEAQDPEHWARHACARVRFSEGLSTLAAADDFAYVEVGPGRGLGAFLLQDTAGERRNRLCVAQCLAGKDEPLSDDHLLARAVAALWCAGAAVDWQAYQNGSPSPHVDLPTYAFDRRRHWVDAPAGGPARAAVAMSAAAAPAAADDRDGPDCSGSPPEGEVEELMARLWARVLGTTRIGRDDNFFRLGGSSLLAVQLRAHVQEALQIDLPLRVLFDRPTLREASAYVEHLLLSELEEEAPTLDAAPPAAAVPLDLPNGRRILQFNQAETAHFYHDIFETEVYARNGISLPRDAVIFDVGANVGLFSLFARERAPDATIFAFEPAPPLFEALRLNMQGAAAATHLFNLGLGAAGGRRNLTFYPYSTGMSTFHADLEEEREALRAIVTNQRGLQTESAGAPDPILDNLDELLDARFAACRFECEVATLSSIIDTHRVDRIDLLKIDVQKSELEVLEGIEPRHWPLIRQIVIEVHDVNGRVARTQDLLEACGFDVIVEQDPLYDGSPICNLYALRDAGASPTSSSAAVAVECEASR